MYTKPLDGTVVKCSSFWVFALPLPTKNTIQGNSSSSYNWITLCNYEDGRKNGLNPQMHNKNNVTQRSEREETIFASSAPIGVSISILWTLPLFKGCIYISRKIYSSEWKVIHISKQAFVWEPTAVITGDKCICMPQPCLILWTRANHALLSPMWVQKRMAVGVW